MSRVLVEQIDEAVKREDADRSKFVRNAVRERLRKMGYQPAA